MREFPPLIHRLAKRLQRPFGEGHNRPFGLVQPAGNLRYLFGEDFMRYVADHQGADVWTRWTHTYGSSIPYILPSKWVFGRELDRLIPSSRPERGQAFTLRGEGGAKSELTPKEGRD